MSQLNKERIFILVLCHLSIASRNISSPFMLANCVIIECYPATELYPSHLYLLLEILYIADYFFKVSLRCIGSAWLWHKTPNTSKRNEKCLLKEILNRLKQNIGSMFSSLDYEICCCGLAIRSQHVLTRSALSWWNFKNSFLLFKSP